MLTSCSARKFNVKEGLLINGAVNITRRGSGSGPEQGNE